MWLKHGLLTCCQMVKSLAHSQLGDPFYHWIEFIQATVAEKLPQNIYLVTHRPPRGIFHMKHYDIVRWRVWGA